MRTPAEVKHAFTPVNKLTESQKQRLYLIEKLCTEHALELMELVPDCADRTYSMRLLLQAKQTCTQAVTHQPPAEAALNKPKSTPKEPETKESKSASGS